jgi:hypothetical protein
MILSAAPQDDKLFHKLEQSLKAEKSGREALMNLVAQAPFTYDREMAFLFLGFISFFVVDEEEELLLPGGVTDNDYYRESIANYKFEFSEYRVPMSATDNSVVQAIISRKPVIVTSWETIRRPTIEEGYARLNQASGGIGCSIVYPLKGKVRGALMYNFFQYPESIGKTQEVFMQRYADIVSKILSGFKSPEALPVPATA